MEIEEFLGEDLNGEVGVGQGGELLEGEEVDVVGRVDGLGGAEDGVGDWVPAAQEGRVFNIVDAVGFPLVM